MRPSRDIIKERAAGSITTVLAKLGIDAPSGVQHVVICNPVRGEKRPSMQIWVKRGYEGAWKDYGAGLQGSVFDLVAYLQGYDADHDGGFSRACDWLCATLGIGNARMPEKDLRRLRQQQQETAEEAARREGKNRRTALGIYLHGSADLLGTPLDTYLGRRGIDLRKLTHLPHALRFHPSHKHRESGQELPCMVALMQDGEGKAQAVHRTWLRPDGSDKADVEPKRKIWPNFGGSIIALARGQSGLSVKDANKHGIADTLVIAEGVEDGLSFAVADPTVRVWAAGSIANIARVPVPSCAADIIVSVDNDWGKPEARQQLERGLEHLRSFGVPVVTVRSGIGKDANDLIRGGA